MFDSMTCGSLVSFSADMDLRAFRVLLLEWNEFVGSTKVRRAPKSKVGSLFLGLLLKMLLEANVGD